MEEASSNDPEGGTKEENQKCFHLFNCDKTFKFDSVEKLLNSLKDIEEKLNFKTSVEKHYFNLSQMSEVCDTIMSGPQMDFAIFVVHANESRLSINEENAGIGYAKIYKALLEKTDGKVIIVIGGDDNYKDAVEEQSSLLSRWAHRKVSSQFDEQFLDGRKSFIFSWDREHRPIHEEAMLHFLDPEKKEETFVPKPVPVEASSNDPEGGTKEENQKCFHLFNCDKTFKFDSVEKLLNSLKDIEENLTFKISVEKHYFNLSQMSEMCDTIMSGPQMDFAIFVVHAHESRLSINEENAGIGYAKIYKALLQKTGEKVIIVIGGDDNYKGPAEERSSLLSRWAHRKVSSQFDEQFLDGRKSFIFSWDKGHRPVHEEALLHYFDPEKKGKKFVPVEPKENQVDPKKAVKSKESCAMDVETETEKHSPDIQTQTPYGGQKTQTRMDEERDPAQDPLQKDKGQHEVLINDFEVVLLPHEQQETEERMDTSEDYVHLKRDDAPKEDLFAESNPASLQYLQAVDTDASPLRVSMAIVYRDQSDIAVIKDVFGEALRSVVPFTCKDPAALTDFLSTQTVRSCFIVVETGEILKEMQKKTRGTPYEDLLRKARNTVETKVFTILCNEGDKISQGDEDTVTTRIAELLESKGVILCCKGNKSPLQTRPSQLTRSQSCPSRKATATKTTQKARPINPEEFTLIFQTRLRHGKISYDKRDVKYRMTEGWTVPKEIENDLSVKWRSTIDVELLIYRENKTGELRTKVNKDIESQLSRMGDTVKGALHSVGLHDVSSSVGSIISGVSSSFGSSISGVSSSVGSSISAVGSAFRPLCGAGDQPAAVPRAAPPANDEMCPD